MKNAHARFLEQGDVRTSKMLGAQECPVIAFNYAEKFNELADLPPLKKLEVLEIAHGKTLRSRSGVLSVVLCVALAVVIGNLPRVLFQLSAAIEGTLPGIGIIAGIWCYHWLYVRSLHENVKLLVREKYSEWTQ